MSARMHVGLILTSFEQPALKVTPSWKEIEARAKAAEDAGFDSIWVSDHLIHKFPGMDPYGIWECWSVLSALAAVTKRVEIGTWVLCTGWRNPALLAKMADTVDEISGGRLILGLGAGWHEPEYTAFGFPFDNRVGRFIEAMQILDPLLRTGHVDFEGRFYSARDCELRPRGPRARGPKIMIGTIGGTPLASKLGVTGTGERMLDLVARHADVWNVPWINEPAEVPAIHAMLDAACARVGREPGSIQRTHGIMLDLPGWQDAPGDAVTRSGRLDMGAFGGDLDALAERLRQFERVGVGEVHVQIDPETPADIERFGHVLERFRA